MSFDHRERPTGPSGAGGGAIVGAVSPGKRKRVFGLRHDGPTDGFQAPETRA
jgi:hypothetical protein